MKVEEVINSYLEYLIKELNYSIRTRDSYESDLKIYINFLYIKKYNYLNINKNIIMEYLKYLDSLKYQNKTISRNLSSIRNFYNYLVDIKLLKDNIYKRIRNPKTPKKLPNYLSITEVEELLNIDEDTKELIRDKCLLELFYSSGIRVSEMSSIRLNDINLSDRSIRIIGKGNKMRIVYFGTEAYKLLEKYLSIRNEFLKKGEIEYLFINSLGGKLSRQSMENIINKISKKANLNRKISPHTLRHTYATHLLDNGADLKSVQELLGHESLDTTEIYTHISNERLKSEYLKYHPNKKRQ